MGYSESKISAECKYCKNVYFAVETKDLTQKQLDIIECLYCGKTNAIKYKVR